MPRHTDSRPNLTSGTRSRMAARDKQQGIENKVILSAVLDLVLPAIEAGDGPMILLRELGNAGGP